MPNLIHKAKLAWVAATVATVVLAGSVATVSAARSDPPHPGNGGYAIDQCANGRWRTFKNPDGSQKFKNQGQCVAFFASSNAIHNFPGFNNNALPGFGQLVSQVFTAVLNFLGNFF